VQRHGSIESMDGSIESMDGSIESMDRSIMCKGKSWEMAFIHIR
jgi:hypothetical protein